MRNNRQSERHAIVIPIAVTVDGETGAIAGQTRNISLGGVFIDTTRTLAMGTRVKLEFKVATQNEPIEVGAVVRWIDVGGIGVQFDGLRARDVWALNKLFEKDNAGK